MTLPMKFYLCRVKPSVGEASEVPFSVLSTHGYVWAETEQQANRMVIDTRTPVVPHPKGRPPASTELRMVSHVILRDHFPSVMNEVSPAGEPSVG